MVRVLSDSLYSENLHLVFLTGSSSDTKPTSNIVGGSMFLETDTGVAYFFDEAAADWFPVGGEVTTNE